MVNPYTQTGTIIADCDTLAIGEHKELNGYSAFQVRMALAYYDRRVGLDKTYKVRALTDNKVIVLRVA